MCGWWQQPGREQQGLPACSGLPSLLALQHVADVDMPTGEVCLRADGFLPKGKKGGDDEDDGKGMTYDDIWCLDLKSHQVGCVSPSVSCADSS